MLKSLHIENIAVIEQTDIEFSEGFNVLTGETGAGKSIIIDSINAILGERTSKELIRNGCDEAAVSAMFINVGAGAKEILEDNGYRLDDDGSLLVMRKLTHAGSTVRINGRQATAGVLKSIGKSLINIHGQHDSQALLDPDCHYMYLDRLADNSELLDSYYYEFHRLNQVRKELAGLETDDALKERRIELLEYQIKELTDADLKPGEADDIKLKLQTIQNAEKTRAALSAAYSYLNGDELSDGAFSAIRNAQKKISLCKNDRFNGIDKNLNEALSYLDAATGQIREMLQSDGTLSVDPDTLRARLDFIVRLTLKYGGSEEKAVNYLADAIFELENIRRSDERIKELSLELDKSTERLIEIGEKLTASRKSAAQKFKHDVTDILVSLDMPNVQFEVSIEKGKYTKHGCDVVEFLIKTNAGESLKPLAKIASGGELSRVMLAIKSVLADKDDVDTLIFDEIDSGISGRAAQKVGSRLKTLSSVRQTLCVTHLAQIAAFAQNHFLIEKTVSGDRTFTTVKKLIGNDRVEEIARIMAGSNLSQNVYNSAKELLERNF
ncbi:MAG: DNA repair protein RecN [Clostridia bacterium]|nr:DNA repair protein RecN [Clostridia bacterium]